MSKDIRDDIFKNLINKEFHAAITVETAGCLAGSKAAYEKANELGLKVDYWLDEGSMVEAGEKIMLLRGNPKQLAQAEEILIGMMAMPSGIATAAKKALGATCGEIKVVAGAWKKMPPLEKDMVRHAVSVGGIDFRITQPPFLYIDKNFVKMFGSIEKTMQSIKHITNMSKCIQLKRTSQDITIAAEQAVMGGADIIMIDSGIVSDVENVIAHLKSIGLRSKVKIAFAGGIKIEDITSLTKKDIDILDIGLQIIGAPLLDMRLDVLNEQNSNCNYLNANLFEKTELWIDGITLENVNLNNIANIVADVLKIERKKVLVIDVQENVVSIDILRKKINLSNIIGKEKELLERLSQLENVKLSPNSSIHSEGILGVITLPTTTAEKTIKQSLHMAKEIKTNISRRVMVFPTGLELIKGHVKDTNSPTIKEYLEKKGFNVHIGNIIDDDVQSIYKHFINALDDGYGIIITTGGTGAEGKDCTIEAVLQLDPKAQTPYIMKFQKNNGRHKKEGVRIAVGEIDGHIIISLPGPNDEVKSVLDIIATITTKNVNKTILAEIIANRLITILQEKSSHYNKQH